MTKSKFSTSIDIRSSWKSAGLLSRMIWEVLFREVEGWKADTLDSMLCDLKYLAEFIEKGQWNFFWEWDDGWTTISPNDLSKIDVDFKEGSRFFRIEIGEFEIKIEEI